MLEEFAKSKGFSTTRIFCDDGFSGKDFERPGFQEMVGEVDKGNISICLTKDDKCKQRIKILCEFFRSRRERELDNEKARHHTIRCRALSLSNKCAVRV
jgi:hypothetical protein